MYKLCWTPRPERSDSLNKRGSGCNNENAEIVFSVTCSLGEGLRLAGAKRHCVRSSVAFRCCAVYFTRVASVVVAVSASFGGYPSRLHIGRSLCVFVGAHVSTRPT